VVLSGGLHKRIYVSLAIIASVCIITIGLVFIDSSNCNFHLFFLLNYLIILGQFGFFALTMGTVIVLNSANGIYQNSIWGLVADFPGQFTNAIVLGNNLCGILMVVIYIFILLGLLISQYV
jgi:solute carrier family 29 (equilibrative nucleoside transporter), member 1/2/3